MILCTVFLRVNAKKLNEKFNFIDFFFLIFFVSFLGGGEKGESSPGGPGGSQAVASAETELAGVEPSPGSEHQAHIRGQGQAGKHEVLCSHTPFKLSGILGTSS